MCSKRSKIFINTKCDEIKIIPIDFDLHFLILKLDDRQNASVLAHSLPDTEPYFKPIGTIETHSAIFYHQLQCMEKFYMQMDTIDQLTCVVDPPQVTTKHDYRIIRLGKWKEVFFLGFFSRFFHSSHIFLALQRIE